MNREMESPNPESSRGAKRKGSPNLDDANSRPAPGPAIHPGNVTQINYLMKAKSEKLRLVEGDAETFGHVLGMIDDYEGVLQRHESLAANLGAKLVGPLLLKSFERVFNDSIKVVQASFGLEQSPVSWLDIVTFARTNPTEFILTESMAGIKTSRFWIKGGQVEISEDDYRLIMSGAPERMIPTQPIPEDEASELGTLNILETRLAMLIKKADAVASKARQLNYHLKGRKTAVLNRKAAENLGPADTAERTFSPQPFSAINARSPAPPNGEAAKIQAQLLEQFMSGDHRASIQHSRPKASRVTTSDAGNLHTFNGGHESDRRMSHPLTSSDDGAESQYRVLMSSKVEKLARGDAIFPPCDRCRRLKFDCTKHLTACSACTKKHAKCSWKDIKDGELDYIPGPGAPPAGTAQHGAPENGAGNNGYVPAPGIANMGAEGHLDPGLRAGLPSAPVPRHAVPVQNQNPDQMNQQRDGKMASEHEMLTQIASAAAAAGAR